MLQTFLQRCRRVFNNDEQSNQSGIIECSNPAGKWGNPNALSSAGAAGIMQIMPDTARDPGYGVTPLQGWDGVDPRTAPVEEQIRFGREYLEAMNNRFGGNQNLTLAAYNAGPGAVEKYGGVPPYEETQNYVQSIGGKMAQQNSDWRSRARPIGQVQQNVAPQASDWRSRAKPIGQAPQGQVQQMEQLPQKDRISGLEALGRGAFYGALQQPANVIAAGVSSLIYPEGGNFSSYLDDATRMSMEGRTGQAKEQRPGYFTTGEIGGNIAMTAIPAAKATSLVGKAAPVAAKAPLIGKSLEATAKGIGASRGLVGVPAAGAIQGGVQSLMTQGDLSGVAPGAIGAGVVGSVGKIARPIADDAISAARKGYTKTLQSIGIDDLTPGQLTGGSNLQLVDSTLDQMLPTAGAARQKAEGQLRKFTQAALKKAGIEADTFTPEVREAAEAQFNQAYSELIENTNVKIDDKLLQKVVDVYDKNINKLPTNTRPIVQSYIDDILDAGNGLNGKAYQVARSQMSRQANSMVNSDPFTAGVLKDLRGALDDAAERSLPEAKQGAWRELNKKYANFKVLTKAISRPSENSLEGLLSPSALNSVIETANKTKSTKSYSALYDLARSGRAVLADNVPNSGTAQRMLAQQLLTAGASGGAIGTGTYAATQDPEAALAAALAGTLVAPKASQMFLNSKAGQMYFTKGIPGLNLLVTPTAKQLGAQINTGLQE